MRKFPQFTGNSNGESNAAPKSVSLPAELFGRNVLTLHKMREMVPRHVHQHLQAIIEEGAKLDPAMADVFATAMKDWAIRQGASHFTHWFHPLTGLTAEKHTAFLQPTGDDRVISEFSGRDLLRGEPDASSFPSGGIRTTFEARGYTGWDPTSPAFIMEGLNGKTLCIPSVFIGWGGQALDKKTALLRSQEALNQQALRILRLFGCSQARQVRAYLGCEQEYFLIDRTFYLQRADLVSTGRTLFGAEPPKGQELEDHYFGTIKERVLAYMQDLEMELYKLGIPVQTRHNEVAPSQFEIAPMFEEQNVATDHNMIMMSVMKSVAHRHGFECLLHEKPFARINGSGKHNNWSLMDNLGNNLVDPGRTPQENAQFLVFLAAIMRGLHLHADLLRATVASAGNDSRLGANEAPPAVISIFLGEKLSAVVDAIIRGDQARNDLKEPLDIGVSSLPPLPVHDSDRNRTSPFAFTGNKFEFRAVGSSQSVALPNTALNVIVADSLKFLADRLEEALGKGKKFNAAVSNLLQEQFREHRAIIFDGDNYSDDWLREAEKRGLPNLTNTVEARSVFLKPETRRLFTEMKVLTEEELDSRYLISLEKYAKTLNIEARVVQQMAWTQIIPAASRYQEELARAINETRRAAPDAPVEQQQQLLQDLSRHIGQLLQELERLRRVHREVERLNDHHAAYARGFRERVLPLMEAVRFEADQLEQMVADEYWPIPKYAEMLYLS
jgi:glutamine synthetase